MSASTRTPAESTPPDQPAHEQSPSGGDKAASTSNPKASKSTGTRVTIGKRKDRNEDVSQTPDQAESSKKPRTAGQTPDIPATTGSELVQHDAPVQHVDVSGSTGKRKQRDEDETPAGENSSTPQTSPIPTSSTRISVPPEQAEEHPSKKQRLDTEVEELKPSPLLTLPLELLADILINTRSPQHVLAVARSSKALCQTLLSPDAAFIWREARKGCYYKMDNKIYKLPDLPEQLFSEPAYAAFIFDSGPCDSCKQETHTMYYSFSLRLRLCKRHDCNYSPQIALADSLTPKLIAILPTNETHISGLINGSLPANFWPEVSTHYRTDDRQFPGYQPEDEGFNKKFEKRAKRKIEWMTLAISLLKWKKAREQSYLDTAKYNKKKSMAAANDNGWDYNTLMTTVYGPYVGHKTKLIEQISDVDLEAMREGIESRLLDLRDQRTRRHEEVTLMNNRKEVAKTYERLRSGKECTYMPNLHTFRTLPVVSMLQSPSSNFGNIFETFRNDKKMKELLSKQLTQWVAQAKGDLGAKLGFSKDWKNASTKILHPAERLSARYLCTRCERFDQKHRLDECLDFAGACSHECGEGKGEKAPKARTGKKAIWKPENFVKDEKAVKALKMTFKAFDFKDEDIGSLGYNPLMLKLAIVCNSCSPRMVLDTGTIIGHSHRHEDMELSLNASMKDIITMMGGYPYEHGLVQKLLGPLSFTDAGKAEIKRNNYGCRHCLRAKQIEDPVAAAAAVAGETENKTDVWSQLPMPRNMNLPSWVFRLPGGLTGHIEGPALAPPPLFTFNGIRSHMKAKHRIQDIRDEDILCYRTPGI